MSDLLCRVVLPATNGVIADTCIMDFAFTGVTTTPALAAAATQTFVLLMSDYLSPALSHVALFPHIDVYPILTPLKLRGGRLGSAIYSRHFTLLAPRSGVGMVLEAALVLSFQASYLGAVEEAGDGSRPRSRRRGRVYFGPLNDFAQLSTSGQVRPKAGFIASMVAYSQRLRDDALTQWGVWSRRDGVIRPVTVVRVDNAFDTQRRRGHRYTSISFG